MEAIKTIHLTKQYRDLIAVNHLNLTVQSGELFSLLGINGAGKTTTIKMLCGLTAPDSGEAYILGHSVRSAAIRDLIAVSPQETAVAPNLTVRENLQFFAGVHGFSSEKQRAKVEELTSSFGFSSILDKKAGKLSGGWQRRLSIALALISEPQVLFLDEPTLGLDVIARQELWDLIRGLKGKITIILTTHYMEEAQALSDRIGIMKAGRLLALGTAADLMATTGADSLEQAFVTMVKEDVQ